MLLGRIPVVLKMQISQFTLQNLLVIGLNFLQSFSTFEPFIQEGYNHVLLLHSQIIDDLSFIGNLLRYKSIKCNIYCIKNLTVIFFKKIFRYQKNHPSTKINKIRSSDNLGKFNLALFSLPNSRSIIRTDDQVHCIWKQVDTQKVHLQNYFQIQFWMI